LNVELLDDLKKAIVEAERILTEEDGGGHQVEVEEPTLGTEPIPDGEIPF
jgi:hypothetical protein